MKKIILLLAFVFVSINIYTQTNYLDVVYLKNGSIIKGVITEQVPGQTIKIKTGDGNIFVYKIEEVEKMTKEETNTKEVKTTEDMCQQGKQESIENYKGKKSGKEWVGIITILLDPVLGLIPAIICSSTEPAEYNLNVPNKELMKNSTYSDCYKKQAFKTKKRKIWTNFGVSTGCYAILLSIFLL